MPNPRRQDVPGAWHHVMNRGVSRRSIFPDGTAAGVFLDHVARIVDSGDLEVHAYSLLNTHFHLLVRSPRGKLSLAMRRIQRAFAFWFNRQHGRDGPLFRGRFLSRPVRTERYRRTLVRYIDFNPVVAGLVERPEHYPYGSARHHVLGTPPPWLQVQWIRGAAIRSSRFSEFCAQAYCEAFGEAMRPEEVQRVDAMLIASGDEDERPRDPLRAASDGVERWLLRRAEVADGLDRRASADREDSVLDLCATGESCRGTWLERRGNNTQNVWEVLRVGLLRDLAGSRWTRIAERLELGISSVRRRYRIHTEWGDSSPRYRQVVDAIHRQFDAWSA